MKNFLQEIVRLKKREVSVLKAERPMTYFVDSQCLLKGIRPFKVAISAGGRVNLIAEIKQRSPSRRKGFFRKTDISGLASMYAKNGARALSLVTDKRFFGGDVSRISEVKSVMGLPVLRKDFIIDEYQVYESRYYGADAILLIARILSKEEIKGFAHLAKRIGMDSIAEIHDGQDLEKALSAGTKMVGINNRDLDTFKVDLGTTFRLLPGIPKGIIKISESGIKTNEDIVRLRSAGVNAVLIGEAFLAAADTEAKIRDIMRGHGIMKENKRR